MFKNDLNRPPVIIDLGGVIINLDVQRCTDAFRELMGDDNMQKILGMGDDGEGTAAVSVATKQLMYDYERGNISTDNFFLSLKRYSKPGTTITQLQQAWLEMLDGIPQERLDYLQQLKNNGYKLYLLSNSNELHWNVIFHQYPLSQYFEQIFASYQLHLAKPEADIFRYVNNIIGITTATPIFIDDIEKNRTSAHMAVGWSTCDSLEDLQYRLKM